MHKDGIRKGAFKRINNNIYALRNLNSIHFKFQVAEHCASLEKNIAEHQERLKIQAELDDTWADDDNDDKNVSGILIDSNIIANIIDS